MTAPATDARALVPACRAVLARHARSFRWAAAFLDRDRRDDAAVVYAFCRALDDTVDEGGDRSEDRAAAASTLDAIEAALRGQAPASPLCAAYLEVAARRGIPSWAATDLVEGMRSDLGDVTVRDDDALLVYCYRVAGTVGVMMCGILGVRDRRALAHAIDLGIAMQLTNICRDVREDLARGRSYLPAARLRAGAPAERQEEGMRRVVLDLLALADRYYESARRGMTFIPAAARLAIHVASVLYRAIGLGLRRRGGDAMAGRVTVSGSAKLGWLVVALGQWLGSLVSTATPSRPPELPSPPHSAS